MSVFDLIDALPAVIPLTEPDRRHVEFAGGTPIVLPDGMPWRFYEPQPVQREVHGENGTEGFVIAWDFGSDLPAETNDSLGQGFHRILAKIDRATNAADRTSGTLEAAFFLLARNYVIGQDDFEDLLIRGADHPVERRERLHAALANLITETVARFTATVPSEAKITEGSVA